jgi:hypothetical protein
MDVVMTGYDTETWTWDTTEVERYISNVEYLYLGCQGKTAEEIYQICVGYDIPLVDYDNVNWAELAQFFGAEGE